MTPIFIICFVATINNSKFTKILYILFWIGLATLAVFFAYFAFEEFREVNIAKDIISPQVLQSETFQVTLPSNGWKFINKKDGQKLMGDHAKRIDIFAINGDATVFAVFSDKEIEGGELNKESLEKVREYINNEYLDKDAINVEEKDFDRGMLISFDLVVGGAPLHYIVFWKAFDNIAIIAVISGYADKKNEVVKSANSFLNNISERPKRDRFK